MKTDTQRAFRFLFIVVGVLLIIFAALYTWQILPRSWSGKSALSLNNLRLVEYDGGPINTKPYQPGDDLYLSVDVSNLPKGADGRSKATIAFEPLDPEGRAIVHPVESAVRVAEREVHVPFHVTVPLYAVGGVHTIRVSVVDQVRDEKIAATVNFQVAGPGVAQDAAFGVQDHAFVQFDGGPALSEASYAADSKLRTRLNVVGFRMTGQNHVSVRVDLGILSAADDSLLDQPNVVAIDQDFFYPPVYIPITTSVKIPDGMPSGTYRVRYVLHDDVSGRTLNIEEPFTIR